MKQFLLFFGLALMFVSASGCSLAVKGGLHAFTASDVEDARDTAAVEVVELEVGVREFRDRAVDLAVGVGFVSGPEATEFQDYRLSGRYHFRRDRRFSPYAGGGVGWFRITATDELIFLDCEVFPLDCFGGAPIAGRSTETLASGWFPHAVGGVNIHLGRLVDWVLEMRYDFAKDDRDQDFGAAQATTGVRLLWR